MTSTIAARCHTSMCVPMVQLYCELRSSRRYTALARSDSWSLTRQHTQHQRIDCNTMLVTPSTQMSSTQY
eukprot:4074-Heterococcus_DN1.PRE.3